MRNLTVTFGNVRVVFRLEQDKQLRTTVDGKQYMISLIGDIPTFTEPANDLSVELQTQIFWAVGHYFMPKK